jgi:hypothetical protein
VRLQDPSERDLRAQRPAPDDAFGVKRLCRVLEIGRSGFYAWLKAGPAAEARAGAEDALAAEIAGIHAESGRAYGAPRVHAMLRRRGRPVNRKRVERIMPGTPSPARPGARRTTPTP